MYKLVLYYLIALVLAAAGLGFFGVLSYSPFAIIFSAIFITTICLGVNYVFAWAFNAPKNAESAYITALILALIIAPLASPNDWQFFSLAIWASVLAMATKYILAIRKKHVFNPAAIALVITALFLNQSANWWIGTAAMAPFVLAGGLLVGRKLIRFDLILSFAAAAAITVLSFHLSNFSDFTESAWRLFVNAPLLFFAFVMLTEPLTTPPTRALRIAYGLLVGFLFAPSIHLGPIFSTPELALVVGNIFSYLVSPKQKLMLVLREKIKTAPNTYDFLFASNEPLKFRAGQYLEWTLDRAPADSRGNRRYFTVASSPTEKNIRIGVKFYEKPSSFKKHLFEMQTDDVLVASQLAGEFVLPKNKNKKLIFIAGGIGVTPFRSMIKYLVDTDEKRDIVIFYANKTPAEAVYQEIFQEAQRKLNIKTVYVTGFISKELIEREAPDFKDRYFYISGPRGMILSFEEMLAAAGVARSRIKTDFFPGFA